MFVYMYTTHIEHRYMSLMCWIVSSFIKHACTFCARTVNTIQTVVKYERWLDQLCSTPFSFELIYLRCAYILMFLVNSHYLTFSYLLTLPSVEPSMPHTHTHTPSWKVSANINKHIKTSNNFELIAHQPTRFCSERKCVHIASTTATNHLYGP